MDLKRALRHDVHVVQVTGDSGASDSWLPARTGIQETNPW